MMMNECTAAYGKIGSKRLLVKNRDKTYEPELEIHHEIVDGVEVLYYLDQYAKHLEGINENGVGIVYTTTNFQDDYVDRNTNNIGILREALSKPDPVDIVRTVAMKEGGVKGLTLISTPQGAFQVENKADAGLGKRIKKLNNEASWKVLTNLPTMLKGAMSEKDGETYICCKIRQAVAEAMLHGVTSVEKAMESLAYKYFANDSHHNPLRDSEFEQTVLQIGMDLDNNKMYLTPVPNKVKKITTNVDLPEGYEPKCELINRDFHEPLMAPFRLFTTNIDESISKFSLVNYLGDKGDEKSLEDLDDHLEKEVQSMSRMSLAKRACDELWEKERMLVSLIRKLKSDPVFFTAGHTSKEVQKEIDMLQGLISKINADYEELINIIHMERYGEPMPTPPTDK